MEQTEIIANIVLAGIFLLLGLIIQISGTLISDFMGHKRTIERLRFEHYKKIDYLRTETFFKKKLEYFERLCEIVQNRAQSYISLSAAIQLNAPNLHQMIKDLFGKNKTVMLDYLPKGAPLYIENVQSLGVFNQKLGEYVLLEVQVYQEIEKFGKTVSFKGKNLIVNKQPMDLYAKILEFGLKAEEMIMLMKKELEIR